MSEIQEQICRGPIALRADNFTPLHRTPWAGAEILKRYKAHLYPERVGDLVGEAWEFSCDPDYPSRTLSGTSLAALIQKHPRLILGPAAGTQAQPNCEILVKLLNAAQPLSLQVHPRDDDSHLSNIECGKPESWLILHADAGCGLFLGFKNKLSRSELAARLRDGDSAKNLLHFVDVKAGDYFEIGPGIPHAIGGGVTLLEPQRVLFGKSGKTYRLWDWGRRYNERGEFDPRDGKPRELHIEAGLRLVDPETQVGNAFVNTLRRRPEILHPKAGIEMSVFPANEYYQTILVKIAAKATLKLNIDHGYAAFVMLQGTIEATGANRMQHRFGAGEPAVFPHAGFPAEMTASQNAEFALVIPSAARLNL